MANIFAYVIAKGIMEVYPGRPFYITIDSFGMVDVHLLKHQKVEEIANAPKRLVRTKDERLSYPSSTHANNRDNSVYAVHCKPILHRLEPIARHEAVK